MVEKDKVDDGSSATGNKYYLLASSIASLIL